MMHVAHERPCQVCGALFASLSCIREMEQDYLGHRLRAERERRKIALESVAEKTKISIGLLRDLERDQLTRWPNGIFRRSFIRAYAAAIGLDADHVLQEFLARYPDPAPSASFEDMPAASLSPTAARVRLARGDSVPTAPAATAALRLILADDPQPFTGGQLLRRVPRRLAAALWDVGTPLVLALIVYVWLERFWIPFATILACYHAGSVLALGNTPGVYFFSEARLSGRDDGSAEPPTEDLVELHEFHPRGV